MGLMRALTLKRVSAIHARNHSALKGRPSISLPTELISTTNNLSYTAPSVETMQQKAAAELSAAAVFTNDTASTIASEAVTEDEHEYMVPQTPTTATSDSGSGSRRSSHMSTGSEPSLTDASSVSSSPVSPDAHHLATRPTSSYFTMDTLTKPSSRTSTHVLVDDSVDPFTIRAPELPRRAPSHSKREHERLARRRSQRTSTRPATLAPLTGLDASDDALLSPAPLSAAIMPGVPEVDEEAPRETELLVPAPQQLVPEVKVEEPAQESNDQQQGLSQELEQLTEVVAESGLLVEDEDARVMRERGLKRWSVSGYLDLVGGNVWGSDLFTSSFGEVEVVA